MAYSDGAESFVFLNNRLWENSSGLVITIQYDYLGMNPEAVPVHFYAFGY
jgi:hypothetical protein